MSAPGKLNPDAAYGSKNYNISKVTLRRRMFMFGAATGTVIGIISTWLDWRSGLVSSLPQDITLALVLSPLFFWAWKTTDPTSPARVGMLVFTLSFIPSIPNELVQMPVFLLWLPAVSLLSFYFFGFREGLIWATGFLTIVLIESIWVLSAVPEPQFESMFVMAIIIYLFLSGTAAAFQYLLESYEQKLLLESEERQAVSERMAEMQKLETIGVLAGGIAHDFNNLLVGVMGNAELAMLDAPRDGVEHYHLGQIVKSAQRGADLVRQMLAYSGQGQVSMGQQNLNILLRDISELLAAVVDKKIRLDPFFTTKKTGTGLGLAALLGIVRSHGGVLSLDSAPGEGSCFSIFFPLAVGRRNTEKLGVSGGIVPTSDEM